MSIITSSTMHDCKVSAHGNMSVAMADITLNRAGEMDVVELLNVPVGTKLVGMRVMTEGLGEDVSLDIHVGDIMLAQDIPVSEQCQTMLPLMPVILEHSETLAVTIKGGIATGRLIVMPEYLSVGYMGQ